MAGKAIAIHCLAHAHAAVAAADALGVPVTLLSAPGAAAYSGAAWFHEVVTQLRAASPDVRVSAYLDCADRPGDALAALRAGVGGVIFTGRADVAEKLAAIASAHGAALLRERPTARDLLDAGDPEGVCRAWLSEP